MIVFAFPQSKHLIKALSGLPDKKIGRFEICRYPNQEMYATVRSNVAHQDCLILGSITPPDENLLASLMLAHTLKKELAEKIILFTPYLAYSRQDKVQPHESLGITTIGELIRASHINQIVTVDLHSPADEKLLPLPVMSLAPAKIFGQTIKRLGWQNATIIAPDEGAIERCEDVARLLRRQERVIYFTKKRFSSGVIHLELFGHPGKRVVLIDDILDTGSTLVACCQNLKQYGVREIIIMVTHGLFTGEKWKKLFSLGVKRVYCTNTHTVPSQSESAKITILTIAPLLRDFAKLMQKIDRGVKEAQKKVGEYEEWHAWEEYG